MKLPQLLIDDPFERQTFFMLSGRYRGVGSIMRFYKKNAVLNWNVQISAITRVQAIVAVDGSYMFGCGQNNYNDRSATSS